MLSCIYLRIRRTLQHFVYFFINKLIYMKTFISARRRRGSKLRLSKHRKRSQKGGNTYETIVAAIDKITNAESVDMSFQTLNDNHMAITPYQMNLLLSKFASVGIPEKEVFPQNIEIIKQIYLQTLHLWKSREFNALYLGFPLSKINTSMNDIQFTNKDIIFNKKIYNFYNSGGFGTVCINSSVNEAIKVINYSKKKESQIIDLIDKEIINYYHISQLPCNSNYFCRLIDIFITPRSNYIFIRMEYCGTDMVDITNKQNTFSFEQILLWFINIAKGIKCMHDNDYAHLDIKPENITILNDDARLIDFGLSYKIKPGENEIFKRGTVDFIAPEMGSPNIDYKKCDIYSLGRTIAIIIYYRYFYSKLGSIFDWNKCLHLVGLYSMIDSQNEQRPSIDTVITALEVKLWSAPSERDETFIFSIAELKQANFTFLEILRMYTFDKLLEIYSVEELKNGGVPLGYFTSFVKTDPRNLNLLRQIKNAGFSIEEMKEKGISLKDFYSSGFSIHELKGKFDASEFIKLIYDKLRN